MPSNDRGPRPPNQGAGHQEPSRPPSKVTWPGGSERLAMVRSDAPPVLPQSRVPKAPEVTVDRMIPVAPRAPEQVSEESILFRMQPHQLPGIVYFYDAGTGARVEQRAVKDNWHGAPVLVFPTNRGDSLIVGPSLREEARDRPEVCQDRAAFEYAADGTLSSFAVGDGISEGAASASIADHLVRVATDLLARTKERVGQRRLAKPLADGLVGLIQGQLRKRFNAEALVDDFLATTKMVPRFSRRFVEGIRSGSVGASTLIAGMVQAGEFPEIGGRGECLTMVQVGDGGYVVIGPYERPHQNVFGEFAPPGSPPGQISPGRPENVPSGSIQVNHVFLRPGEMVIVVTDGIEKGVWRTLQAFRRRAQELFQAGYTDPNQLVRQLLWEANGQAVTWADDITMFAHKAQ